MFYQTEPSPSNIGLKQVLFKITDNYAGITHDYGYANWTGKEWDAIDVPEGFLIEVHSWANNPDPEHLVNESKIIRLN